MGIESSIKTFRLPVRLLVAVGTGALIMAGANMAIAVTNTAATATATCNAAPVTTYGADAVTLAVTCTAPLPPPVTITVTAPPVTTTITVTAPPVTTTAPTMAVGARAKAEDPASTSQLRADFMAASTDIGPLSATRAFNGTLPVDQSQRISATGNIEVTSYKSAGSSSLAPFVRSMPAQDMIAFYHEPEGPGDWSSGAAYVAAFNAEYKAAHAANPKVQFGMIAGAYQYRTAGLGYSGTFIPPLADFYAIDTYRDGSSENAYGAILPLTQVTEFQRWLSLVKAKGKPLLVTEYGRGTVGSGELATTAGKRAVVIAQDLPYLRSLGFTMISYWYSDFGPDGRKWRFTDQASIDAWRSG